jgi:hypothetical protein
MKNCVHDTRSPLHSGVSRIIEYPSGSSLSEFLIASFGTFHWVSGLLQDLKKRLSDRVIVKVRSCYWDPIGVRDSTDFTVGMLAFSFSLDKDKSYNGIKMGWRSSRTIIITAFGAMFWCFHFLPSGPPSLAACPFPIIAPLMRHNPLQRYSQLSRTLRLRRLKFLRSCKSFSARFDATE